MTTFMESWKAFWGELGANQKVSIGISILAIIAAMAGLLIWAQQPNMRLLYGSVNPKDAAAIVQHLDSQAIPYDMRAGGSAIFVPEDMVYQARMDVVSQGLVQGDAVGFEIFDKSSFGISDFVQRTNFIRAIQGELARTITQLNGVRSARVMVVMPDNRLLLVNRDVETTASVFVDVGGSTLGESAVRSIQSLVANAVEGLRVANVAVVDNIGNVLSSEEDDEDLMGASKGVVEYRQNLENYFSAKVETMLERVVGPGNAVVRVSADIDASHITRMEEDFNDQGTVLRRQQTTEESSTSINSTESVVSMQLEEGGGGTPPTPSQTSEDSLDRDQEYEIDRVVTNTVRAPGEIRKITASVFVAQQTQPGEADSEPIPVPRTAAQLQQLREMVANALGISLDDPEAGSVAIQEVPFSQTRGVAPDLAAASTGFDLSSLLRFGEEIFGGIVALILFLVFLNLLKRTRSESTLFQQLEASRQQQASQVDLGQTQAVTPELLNELIRQKPDNAGTTLRNWLSGGPQAD